VLAVTGNSWLEAIITLSIVVPLGALGALVWVVLRGARHDPDEQRWRRLAEQKRDAEE
jgi:hypothetical protein